MGYIFFLGCFHRVYMQAIVMKEIRLFFIADNNPEFLYRIALATAFSENFNLKLH